MSILRIYKKGPVGCLLVHGFTGSPKEIVELAEYLVRHNITVSSPTLPGHGTHSADLFNYTWRDWYNCVKDAYDELASQCEEIFVVGLSMGGTLALHLAAHNSVDGIVSMAAALDLPRRKKYMVRILKVIIKFHKKRGREDVRDKSAKSRLDSYQRYPLYAANQVFQLIDHVRNDLPEIIAPILILHSKYDNTVPFSNSELIFNSVSSKDKRKVDLEQSYHVITVDFDKEKVEDEVFDFIQSHSNFLKVKKRGVKSNP